MSSMLEQAIIDAAALREAALKNAEQAIIEKYAPEVKAAVASLLEGYTSQYTKGQTVNYEGRQAVVTVEGDDGMVGIQEEGGKTYLVQEVELSEISDQVLNEETEDEDKEELEEDSGIPSAAINLTGESLEEGEQVVFEFTASDFLEEGETEAPPVQEDTLGDMAKIGAGEDEALESPEASADDAGGSGELDKDLSLQEETLEEKTIQELVDILNEFDTGEEPLEEELVVDMKGDHKDGTFQSSEEMLKYYQEMELAKQEATDTKEENEELNKKLEELDESQKRIKEQNAKLNAIVQNLNEKLQSTLLSNAKLLYSNRALNDASLNERQKTKIVEAINKAQSVEEAKNLHETLRVTVGQSPQRGPQSLSETVSRKSNLSSMLTSKKQDNGHADNFSERMRRLAGIK